MKGKTEGSSKLERECMAVQGMNIRGAGHVQETACVIAWWEGRSWGAVEWGETI